MKKQLKISLAATAVAVTVIGTGLTSYAMAQERRLNHSGGQGGGAAASKVEGSKPNGVIRFLEAAVWCSQDSYLTRTNDEKAKGQIVEASNRATFAMLNAEQQKDQEKALMIDRFAPDKGLWRDIAKTPSVVHALLDVTKEQVALANKIDGSIWDKIMHPTDEVKAASGLLGLSQNEKLAELANPRDSKPVQQHRRWLDSQYEAGCVQMRNALTPEQKKEWDTVWTIYRKYLPKNLP